VKPTAFIADDEPLARRKLRDLVASVPLVDIVGESDNGESTVEAVDRTEPDILLLDVEMPGLSGLGVLQRIRHQPAVIFTTAHDRYAVTAFELAAVDYLLKPFGKERFRFALERALRSLPSDAGTAERVQETLGSRRLLRRIFVRDRGKILPVNVREVDRFEARDDYVIVHTRGSQLLLRIPLQTLSDRLDPDHFVRVHRSHMVNLDAVEAFEPYDGSRLEIRMRDGSRILASRTRSKELRGRID